VEKLSAGDTKGEEMAEAIYKPILVSGPEREQEATHRLH
jgi:hypothetical protein